MYLYEKSDKINNNNIAIIVFNILGILKNIQDDWKKYNNGKCNKYIEYERSPSQIPIFLIFIFKLSPGNDIIKIIDQINDNTGPINPKLITESTKSTPELQNKSKDIRERNLTKGWKLFEDRIAPAQNSQIWENGM